TEKPKIGDTEVWSFMNITDFPHPIHIHLIQFQVLNRQAFDLDLYNETKQIVFTGAPTPPKPNERGWKDTVSAPPGEFTRVIVKFGPYTGRYVWHCHILEHEEYDMMRPYDVMECRCSFIDLCLSKSSDARASGLSYTSDSPFNIPNLLPLIYALLFLHKNLDVLLNLLNKQLHLSCSFSRFLRNCR